MKKKLPTQQKSLLFWLAAIYIFFYLGLTDLPWWKVSVANIGELLLWTSINWRIFFFFFNLFYILAIWAFYSFPNSPEKIHVTFSKQLKKGLGILLIIFTVPLVFNLASYVQDFLAGPQTISGVCEVVQENHKTPRHSTFYVYLRLSTGEAPQLHYNLYPLSSKFARQITLEPLYGYLYYVDYKVTSSCRAEKIEIQYLPHLRIITSYRFLQ
jgi:hypothetical protein